MSLGTQALLAWDRMWRNDGQPNGGAPGGGHIVCCLPGTDCSSPEADKFCISNACISLPGICVILGKVTMPEPCMVGAMSCPSAPDQSQ